MRAARRDFGNAYAAALRAHLAGEGEPTLHAAYELGREALVRELSVLDLGAAHHETLRDALRGATVAEEPERIAAAAGDFFLEALAAFEMVQRGVREARDAAIAERRRSTMLRQLSSLLSDPSLADDALASIVEALRLVAEEARELTEAAWCVASAEVVGGRHASELAGPPSSAGAGVLVAPGALLRRRELVADAGGLARLRGQELAAHPAFAEVRDADEAPALDGWMAATLTSLDGRQLGCLEVFDSRHGRFTELDEAILVHVAQMASAALERARLHLRRR